MKHFPILQGRAYVMELPEGATNPEVHTRSLTFDTPMEVDEWGYDYQSVKLPEGTWQIVGMLPEVTEEWCKGVVKLHATLKLYKDYDSDKEHPTNVFVNATALESFHSAIRASGWLLENIYPDINDPKFYDEPYDGSGFYQELYSGALDDWKQRQSRTLNPELTLILERK